MKTYFHIQVVLVKRLLLLAVIYQLCRVAFYLANYPTFSSATPSMVAGAFVAGFRFDLAAIAVINLPFIFLHLIPTTRFFRKGYQLVLRCFFLVFNIPAILFNCIDLEYFKYQGKRTTADMFHLFTMGDDMRNTMLKMVADFWYVLAVFAALCTLFVWAYNRIRVRTQANGSIPPRAWLPALAVFLFFVISTRGGLQYKPIGIMAAASHTTPQLVPLVLNTPFTIYKTFGKPLAEEKEYMPHDEALRYFNKDHQYRGPAHFRPLNVVIIILESFSSEYIGAFNNGTGYTPFLDSLMSESLTFRNGYANAKKSIDGIPAVVASMPTLMADSYISSPYNSNQLRSIAGILKSKGYTSAFFHGGNNGTMNFNNFTLLSGFDAYYGRQEYPGTEYDGSWGIFDEPFYHFFVRKVTTLSTPFVTAIFSISSHHPYTIPPQYKGRFPKGTLPIHESIGYADYALSRFFAEARMQPWFANTLFVITADHTGPAETPRYNNKSGIFRVPIVYYYPAGNLCGWPDRITQQTDIVPGILDFLHYDEPFTAFGNSPFDTTQVPFAINYTGDAYQILDGQHLIQFDGTDVTGYYDYRKDPYLLINRQDSAMPSSLPMLNTMKSVLQQYNHALIRNELIPPGS